ARSGTMLLGDRHLDLGQWRDTMQRSAMPLDFEAFERHVNAEHLPHAAIVDCTASDEIAGRYPRWLRSGIHVATRKTKTCSGEAGTYEELRESARAGSSHCC